MIKLRSSLMILASVLVVASIYLFSRFTVDDAFISWRYGKNLVDFGIWNYNPSSFDLTQAYTNPIYAVLSIVPNLFGWDVVLFFKLVSIAVLIAFFYCFGRKTRGSWLMLLALIGLPATVVHIFGGLETFLFVILMGALLIAAYEERMGQAITLALALFLTRPEAWCLVGLLPLYFLISEPPPSTAGKIDVLKYVKNLKFAPAKFAITLVALAAPLGAYLLFHRLYFGSALPNTFYVKFVAGFSPMNFGMLALFVFPLAIALPVALLLHFQKIKVALLMATMFGAMALDYSVSSLQMNYAGRFAFHIFVPVYLFFVYLASRLSGRLYISRNADFLDPLTLTQSGAAKCALLGGLAAFALISDNFSTRLLTYYPRALASHAALGKTINQIADKYGIHGFSLADAGMAAYHSGINALDNNGLASAAVTRNGFVPAVLDQYKLNLIFFHATDGGIRLDIFNQQKLHDWAVANGFHEVCDIYWQKDYILKAYTKEAIVEISDLCKRSKVNDVTDRALLKSAILVPPWKYWTE